MCIARSFRIGGACCVCSKGGESSIDVGEGDAEMSVVVSRNSTVRFRADAMLCSTLQVVEKPESDGKLIRSLDQALTPEGIQDVVERTVDRLLQVDSASLETIKMQVAFDSSYIAEEESLEAHYQRRDTRMREMQRTIACMKPKPNDVADFDALTALHRQVCHCMRATAVARKHTRKSAYMLKDPAAHRLSGLTM